MRPAERRHGERRIDAHQQMIGTLVPTEREVHAVADDGNVVSLTSDASKAMKMGADHGPDSEDFRDACKHCDGVDIGT